jgi:prepilin-type N-terminal cleavage/methylation domain-containing protein
MRPVRPGVTLLEVLVAIFIMGVGMLAILVLFPLAALNMARALKDDRTGSIAPNADFLAQATGLRNDLAVVPKIDLMAPAGFGTGPPAGYPPPDPNLPSYPVFIDPYYFQNSGGTLNTVGTPLAGSGFATSAVWRVTPQSILNLQNPVLNPPTGDATAVDRFYSLTDDLTFETNGLPRNFATAGGPLERQGYYTWAYCLQRLKTGQANTASLTVIVYQGRPLQTPTLEPTYQVSPAATAGTTSLTLTWAAGATPPELRRGNWLMDNTFVNALSSTLPRQPVGYAHAKFYRVMEAVPLSATSMQVEVFPSLRDNGVSQVTVMDKAIEIFERGIGR